jgi:serine/threonine protein kinase
VTAIGRYRIGARLGTGGSADVFAVELIDGGGRPLALKRLRRELVGNPAVAALFDGELALARRLHHGGIVQLFDHGVDGDGAPFLVIERVEGVALDELLAHLAASGRRLEVADAALIAIERARRWATPTGCAARTTPRSAWSIATSRRATCWCRARG